MRLLRTKRLIGAAALVAVATLGLSACASSAPAAEGSTSDDSSSAGAFAKDENTLIFAATPDQAGTDQNVKPLLEYIAKEMDMEVEYFPTSDYTALIAAMVAGKADVTTSGGLQYVMATNKGAAFTPVAAQLNSPDVTEAGYYSEAIVNPDSGVTDIAGFKGKNVCFVDPNSTSGFLYGLFQLSNAGINVTASGTDANGNPTFDDFTAVFAGAHDKSEQAVAAGQCDVGFAEDIVAEAGAEKGEIEIVGKELVVGGPLTISDALPEDVKTKLTEVLRGATPEKIEAAGIELTEGFKNGFFGVETIDASYYDALFKLCTDIDAANCAK